MKPVLLARTALVAASAVAAAPAAGEEGVQLELGGYYNTYFGFGAIDEGTTEPRDFGYAGLYAEGEVHFHGKTTLDNGITFGVQIELEAFQAGDQIDENYAFVEGNFGRVVIGGENTAALMLQVAAPRVGMPINTGWITNFIPPLPGSTAAKRTPALSTFLDIGDDNHGITYYTPRIAGFQLAGSWVPTPATSFNGTGDGRNSPVFADQETEIHDVLSVGANYMETFGDFNVAVAGGFSTAAGPDSLTPAEDERIYQYSTGLVVGYAGFKLGGSFALEDSERLSSAGQSVDGWSYDVGASYSTGPWSAGVIWFQSEVEGLPGVPGEDELSAFEVGVAYAVGPGITANLSGLWGEWEDEGGDDQSGIVGILGMKIGF